MHMLSECLVSASNHWSKPTATVNSRPS